MSCYSISCVLCEQTFNPYWVIIFVCADYSRYSSVATIWGTLGRRTLQDMGFISRMRLFYHASHHQTLCVMPSYIPLPQPRTRTSHNQQHSPPQADSDKLKCSIIPKWVRIWSILSSIIAKSDFVDTFRHSDILQSIQYQHAWKLRAIWLIYNTICDNVMWQLSYKFDVSVLHHYWVIVLTSSSGTKYVLNGHKDLA